MKDTKQTRAERWPRAQDHGRAMNLMFFSSLKRNAGRAREMRREALELEQSALRRYTSPGGEGRWWNIVLHRSTGWIALNAGCPALPRQVAMRSPEPDSHPLESIGNLADAAVLDGRETPEELPG